MYHQGALAIYGLFRQNGAGALGHEDIGQQLRVYHVAQGAFHIVVDDDGDGAAIVGILLLLRKVQIASGNHGHLTGDVHLSKVLGGAEARNHYIGEFITGQIGDGKLGNIREGHIHVIHGDVVAHDIAVLHAGHHSAAHIGGGRGHHAVIRVFRKVVVGAVAIHERGGVAVAGGNGGDHVAFQNPAENLIGVRAVAGKTGGRTKRHIHGIHIQPVAVFQSGQNVVKESAAFDAEDLHDDELGIRGHTDHVGVFHPVGGGDTGHMGAMGIAVVVVVGDVQGLIHIVKAEGNLGAAVQLVRSQLYGAVGHVEIVSIGVLEDAGDFLRGQAGLRQRRIGGEGGMILVQASVNDSDPHTLTAVAQSLPGFHGTNGILGDVGVGVNGSVGHVLGHIVLGRHEGSFHAGERLDLFQIAVGHFQSHTVDCHVVVILHFHRLIHDLLNALKYVLLPLGQGFHLTLHSGVGGGNLGGGEALLQKALVFQHHDDPDGFVLGKGRLLHGFGRLV